MPQLTEKEKIEKIEAIYNDSSKKIEAVKSELDKKIKKIIDDDSQKKVSSILESIKGSY